jgi:outer membrane protein OmpA-like peptidoglycan-associated protein
MSLRKTLLVASVALAWPAVSQGQIVTGLYLGGGLGANFLASTDVTGSSAADKAAVTSLGWNELDFSWGYVGVLSLGWGFGNGIRAEIEGSFRENEVSGVSQGNVARSPSSGAVRNYGLMGNIFYDFNLNGGLGGLTPYIGVGAGYVHQHYDDVGTRAGGVKKTITQSDGNFGGQAIVGLALPISSVPGLSATAEYRYLMTAGHEVVINGRSADIDNVNHSLLIGLRYAFNAAPAVAAAAPVAAARTFLVFFDWSKSDLTDRARQIIGEAAASRGQGVTRIEVNGFTDRSGPADYNMQLSIRRANAVAAELVRRGVPRNEIVTRGFGEENNLVPTADGVREPQNRRVEIVLK